MTIEDLTCKIECQDMLVQLCAALDRGDNAKAAEFYADEIIGIFPNGKKSAAEMRARLDGRSPAIMTRHIITNVFVTPTGPDRAQVNAYILVYRVPLAPEDSTPWALPSTPQAVGDWDFEVQKGAAGWQIQRYSAIERFVPK